MAIASFYHLFCFSYGSFIQRQCRGTTNKTNQTNELNKIMNANVLRMKQICLVNHNGMEINMLQNHTFSNSNSIDFGIQSHWVWQLKALGLAPKSIEIEIQPQ